MLVDVYLNENLQDYIFKVRVSGLGNALLKILTGISLQMCVCVLFESLTVFFEASKASLFEVTCVLDLPL